MVEMMVAVTAGSWADLSGQLMVGQLVDEMADLLADLKAGYLADWWVE